MIQGVIGWLLLFWVVQASAGQTIDSSLKVAPRGDIHIELARGQLRLVGWGKQQISIRGTLDDQAETLQFFRNGNTTHIKVKLPDGADSQPRWGGAASRLQVFVPKNARVRLSGGHVDVRASNLYGGYKSDTDGGHVGLTKVAPLVEVYSRQGSIHAEKLAGKIRLRTLSGNIRDRESVGDLGYLSLSGDIDVDTDEPRLSVETRTGDIKLRLLAIAKVVGTSSQGQISVQARLMPEGQLELTSRTGHIRVSLPRESDAKFELSSDAGEINNGLNTIPAEAVNGEPGSKLIFSTGNGNGRVRLNSVIGDIQLAPI